MYFYNLEQYMSDISSWIHQTKNYCFQKLLFSRVIEAYDVYKKEVLNIVKTLIS